MYARKNDELDFARKIAALMDDPGLHEEMGKAGRERIEKVLAWKFQAPHLIEAYQKILIRPEDNHKLKRDRVAG